MERFDDVAYHWHLLKPIVFCGMAPMDRNFGSVDAEKAYALGVSLFRPIGHDMPLFISW